MPAARRSAIIDGGMKKVFAAAWRFMKREAVLCVSVLLAVLSACFVPPDEGYLGYVDWDTLALLFALMGVMQGFQRAGLFAFLAERLLRRANTSKKLMAALVFLPFFLSMAVTNDVSLITFVPFAIVTLKAAKLERLLLPTVVLQTLAANLGSTLTPMGNPQNLYLYNLSGMGFGDVVLTMLPYAALSAVLLGAAVLCFPSVPAERAQSEAKLAGAFRLAWPAVGFAVCLLGLFKIVPPLVIAALLLLFLLFADRRSLTKIDYSLLGTFVALFVFIGNMGRIAPFREFLSSVIAGNEMPVALLASQVISNVPAALLLAGFTQDYAALMVGCNLGGLGTLIASMASLISFKSIAKEYPSLRGKYLLQFTLYNIAFLAPLTGLYYLLAFLS